MVVSIILPIFNVDEYLAECLESVIVELKPDREVILVNDGSTDNSASIIATYKERYPELIVVNKENGGLSSARNKGLETATGKYILFVDADDVLEPQILEKLVQNAEKSDAEIAVADYYEFEQRNQKRVRYDKALFTDPLVSEEDRLLKLFTIEVSFAVWNKLYNSEFLKQNNLKFLPGYWFEDLDFVFRAFYFARKVVKTDGLLIGYRQRSGSIMNSISLKILDKMDVMDKLAIFLKDERKFKTYEEMYKILYLKMMFSIIYPCIKVKGDTERVRDIISKLFSLDYFNKIKTAPLLMRSKLKRKERIFFSLIKLGLVNPSSLNLLCQLMNIGK